MEKAKTGRGGCYPGGLWEGNGARVGLVGGPAVLPGSSLQHSVCPPCRGEPPSLSPSCIAVGVGGHLPETQEGREPGKGLAVPGIKGVNKALEGDPPGWVRRLWGGGWYVPSVGAVPTE